jgi:hypothetical protein
VPGGDEGGGEDPAGLAGGGGSGAARGEEVRAGGGPVVAVIGAGDLADDHELVRAATTVGRALARRGVVVVCGGLGGVMAGACRGAAEAGGMTVGILPGRRRAAANPWVQVAVATGLGEARNAVVAATADAVVAVGGEYGTLSEIALALKAGTPVVGYRTWQLGREAGPATDIVPAATPEDAADLAADLAGAPPLRRSS